MSLFNSRKYSGVSSHCKSTLMRFSGALLTLWLVCSIVSGGVSHAQDTSSTASATGKNYPDRGVRMSVQVHLRSADSANVVLVENRIWEIPLQRRFSGFLANMSVELRIEQTDSVHLNMNVFLTTVGSRPDTRTRSFSYELGLPATIDNIRGKAGATYSISLTPKKFIPLDMSGCDYDHRVKGDFSIDPTANFDLHFVKNSLGDYHWNEVKELLESEYRVFKKNFDINRSGKVQYYLYPCATKTVAWDPRFGFAIDPTRSQALGIYNHDYMAPAHLIAILTQVMRVYGYAPPFLAEGIAGYFYFFDFETMSAVRDSAIIPLKDIITTEGYYSADPILATAEAGSFCRFLADTYGIDTFRRLYRESDDLNIADKFKEIYQADISELEKRWVSYLLQLRPKKSRFVHRARLEGAGNNIAMAITVMQSSLAWDTTFSDTLATLTDLGSYYSEAGKYALSLRTYQTLFEHAGEKDSNRPYFLLRVGYFQSLLGKYDSSMATYRRLRDLDTNFVAVSEFNLARVESLSGDTAGAIKRLQGLIEKETDPILLAEEGNTLGLLLGAPGKYNDPAGALEAFERAESSAQYVVKNSPNDGPNRFRLGVAYLGTGQYDVAQNYIDLALFLEFRPRYMGRELIALGNLADMQGNRKQALLYYNRADSLDKSAPGQFAAKNGLKKRFVLNVKKPESDKKKSTSERAPTEASGK